MLAEDMLTGRLYELPDYQVGYWHEAPETPLYGQPQSYPLGEVLYDGLGNPLGIASILRAITAPFSLIRGAVSALTPRPAAPRPFPLPSSTESLLRPLLFSLINRLAVPGAEPPYPMPPSFMPGAGPGAYARRRRRRRRR